MLLIASLAAFAPACGKKKSDDSADEETPTKKKKKKKKYDDDDWDIPAPKKAKAPPLTLTPGTLGFKRPTALSYRWGRGAAQYKRCQKAIAKKDWAGAQKSCEAAIAKDSRHVHARYALAQAMAQQKTATGIAEHLSHALATDWVSFGPNLQADPLLAAYWRTAEGSALAKLNETYKTSFIAQARAGILMLGRRGKHSKPTKPGRQWSSPRAEVFSYDIKTKRYLRITTTKQSIAGFLLSPSGSELAYLTYSYLDWPKSESSTVLLGSVRVGVIDFESMLPKLKKDASVRGYYRRVELEYSAGDELIVSAYKADGKDLAAPLAQYLDKGSGKLKRRQAPDRKAGHLVVMFEAAWIERGKKQPGIAGSFPSRTFTLTEKKVSIKMLEDEQVMAADLFWSPNKAHLLVRTLATPCDGEKSSSIYLAEAAGGKLHHILRGESRWDARWIDNDRFVYEDPKGGLRIYDVAKRRQVERLHNYGGLALHGLGGEIGPICVEGTEDSASQTGAPVPGDEDEDEDE